MKSLIIGLMLSGTVQASTPVVQAASWDFAGFNLEIDNQWYFFEDTHWTLKEVMGVSAFYESDVETVTENGETVTAQVFTQLYRPYCGRSRCVVYRVLSETVSLSP